MFTRLVARAVYPFWRLYRLVDGGEARDAIERWLDREIEYRSPTEPRIYRFTQRSTVAGPDTPQREYLPGETAWLPKDVGEALRGAVEPVEWVEDEEEDEWP